MSRRLPIMVLFLAALQVWGVAQDYKVDTTGACSDKELAEGIRNSLQPQGARLVYNQGTAVGELWLRRALPVKGAASANYSVLDIGTLAGVLHFPAKGADFRGQPIKAGYYTLRYAQIPQDGNHMGAAPYSDFLLLVPAAADKELDAKPKFDDLVKLSRQASGTNHPAVLMLVPATATSYPSVVRTDQGYWAVGVKTQAKPEGDSKPKDFPLAVILVGKAE